MDTICFLVTVSMASLCQGIVKNFHRAEEFEGNIETSQSLLESLEDLTPIDCVRKCYRDPACYSIVLQDGGHCGLHHDYLRIYNNTPGSGISYSYFERGSCEESRGLNFVPTDKFCFMIIQRMVPFSDAQDQCVQEGLTLAKPDTAGKVDAVARYLQKNGYAGLHMHTSLTYVGGAWTWGDGTLATDVMWRTNQPGPDPASKPCGNLFYWFGSANYYNLVCTQTGSVLCEKLL